MVALERAVRNLEVGHAVGFDFRRRFAKGQGLGLGKKIGHQQIVMPAQRVERPVKPMKSHGISLVPW